jgi:hypothetical protein
MPSVLPDYGKLLAIGLLGLCGYAPSVTADAIALQDFIYLQRGMTEAEVLYRVGPYDYESVYTDGYHNVIRKVWHYIPQGGGPNRWITEIEFDRSGRVSNLERYKP